MSYNVKNYTEQGGDVTHIGGKLVFEEGASVEGSLALLLQRTRLPAQLLPLLP